MERTDGHETAERTHLTTMGNYQLEIPALSRS